MTKRIRYNGFRQGQTLYEACIQIDRSGEFLVRRETLHVTGRTSPETVLYHTTPRVPIITFHHYGNVRGYFHLGDRAIYHPKTPATRFTI